VFSLAALLIAAFVFLQINFRKPVNYQFDEGMISWLMK